MNIEGAIATLHALLDKSQESIVADLQTVYPDRQIEKFAHRHCDEMYCMGVRAEWRGEKDRFVALEVNLMEVEGKVSGRGFVVWDETYLGSDGFRHICHDGATRCHYSFEKSALRSLADETVALEEIFRDALARARPLIPSPIESVK